MVTRSKTNSGCLPTGSIRTTGISWGLDCCSAVGSTSVDLGRLKSAPQGLVLAGRLGGLWSDFSVGHRASLFGKIRVL